MKIEELVDLKSYTTFRMGPQARHFGVIKTTADLETAYAFAGKAMPVVILGSGSNIILNDTKTLEALVLKIEIPGVEIGQVNKAEVRVKVGAGEIWDNFVLQMVACNFSGLEALSGIPGTVGATPIQNVGAYGSEVKDVIVSLEAYEVGTGTIKTFSNEQCQFSYRDSVFKNELKNRFVIVSVTFKLSTTGSTTPNYAGVQNYFTEKNITNPTLLEIRNAIIEIRHQKLPDPKVLASVGSFFKNPFINTRQFLLLKSRYPNIVGFAQPNDTYKISAGWLLETLNLKGQDFGHLQFYPGNALVLVNKNTASFLELQKLVGDTQAKVKHEFGITLEQEPQIIS